MNDVKALAEIILNARGDAARNIAHDRYADLVAQEALRLLDDNVKLRNQLEHTTTLLKEILPLLRDCSDLIREQGFHNKGDWSDSIISQIEELLPK